MTKASSRVDPIQSLTQSLRKFARQRAWDQFHTPKNLASALAVEAGELLEHFQWLNDSQSSELIASKRGAVAEEIADVFLYLLRLSDRLGIDPVAAAKKKLIVNARKYPVKLAKGNSKKYSELI